MNWFSNLFKKDVGSSGYIQPDQPWPRATPMPEVKPPKPEKNISEPVFAIVECMKKYPSRFKAKYTDETEPHVRIYKITDVKTKQTLEIRHGWYSRGGWDYSWQWLTRDERSILEDTFHEINNLKKDRMHSIQRAKMKGFYK